MAKIGKIKPPTHLRGRVKLHSLNWALLPARSDRGRRSAEAFGVFHGGRDRTVTAVLIRCGFRQLLGVPHGNHVPDSGAEVNRTACRHVLPVGSAALANHEPDGMIPFDAFNGKCHGNRNVARDDDIELIRMVIADPVDGLDGVNNIGSTGDGHTNKVFDGRALMTTCHHNGVGLTSSIAEVVD